MTKLEGLIKELCPNGVEYKRLADVIEITRGTRVVRSQLDEKEGFPVYQNSMIPLGYYDASNRPANTTFVIGAGAAGEIGFCAKPFWAADDCICFNCPETVSSRYLYHVLLRQQNKIHSSVRKASVPRLSRSVLENLQIPLPPLAVQCEIVRILDDFTEEVKTLQCKLREEFYARRKQYEYYRDKLLHFDSDIAVQYYEFGEIADIVRGASPRPISKFLTDDDEDGINWIKIGDVEPKGKYIIKAKEKITQEGAEHSRMVYPGDFVLSNSMSFGRPYILKITGCIHDGWLAISGFQNYLLSDFLYYLLSSDKIQKEFASRASNGTVQNLNSEIVKRIQIPVPSLEIQEKIVETLDKLDRLFNALSEELPAEIEARQKQYEFYRDKLLTFEEKVG